MTVLETERLILRYFDLDDAPFVLTLLNEPSFLHYIGDKKVRTLDAARQYIINGRGGVGAGNATWLASGGIMSSTAATDPDVLAIGYGENSEMPFGAFGSFRGTSLDTTSIVITSTRTGDATLNSLVNDNDVTVVGIFYPQFGSGEWYLGDFDYTNGDDDNDITVLGIFEDPGADPFWEPGT